MREFARLVRYDTLSGLTGWRWAAVPAVFAFACWSEVGTLRADDSAALNVWDGPLRMLLSSAVLIWVVGLGFMLLVGDRYAQDRSRGTLALTLVRTRSRTAWWLARVTSIGALAFAFTTVGLVTALVVSGLRLPLELDPSPAAQVPWPEKGALYPRYEELPMPASFGLALLYTALALWPLGALGLLASALSPQVYVPVGAAILWAFLEAFALPDFALRDAYSVDPFFHLGYAGHFTSPGGAEGVSWGWSAGVIAVVVAAAGAIGALGLRRGDL